MTFLRLTGLTGKQHMVNLAHVALISESEEGCDLGIVAPPADLTLRVREGFGEVARQVERLTKGDKP